MVKGIKKLLQKEVKFVFLWRSGSREEKRAGVFDRREGDWLEKGGKKSLEEKVEKEGRGMGEGN